jgi:nucleotide-binding universal stress UspA family protein
MLREDNPILVATDLQPGSDDAIREGHARAAASRVPLVVCHILEGGTDIAAANTQLVSRVHELTGRERDSFEVVLAEGAPAEVIAEQALRRSAGLICVGPGRTHLMVGDTTGKVIRNAHAAVLVARPPVESGVVVACTDFSDGSYPALVSGEAEARRVGGDLVAMHVVPIDTMVESDVMGMGMGMGASLANAPVVTDGLRAAAAARLARVLAARHIDARLLAVAGEPALQILRVASSVPARLLVVGTHGRKGWRHFFIGSVAEQIAHEAPCSVLIERLNPPLAS